MGIKKKQRVGTCLLQSFIISLVWWRWSHCRTTWLRLHDHLRCKITGLAPRDGLNASLPLFLLCRPLRCLTFTADSIITAVWEGIKRDVACSFSHLLNIQLHYMGHLKRRRRLDSRDPFPVQFCQNSWYPAVPLTWFFKGWFNMCFVSKFSKVWQNLQLEWLKNSRV